MGVIPNLILVPGLDGQKNTYEFKAAITLSRISALFNAARNDGHLEVSSNGTTIDGTYIDWLSAPLVKLTTQVPFNLEFFK